MRIATGATRRVRVARAVGRVLVGMLSLVVVAVTAFAWTQVRMLDRSTPAGATLAARAGPATDENILLLGVDSRTDGQGNPLPQSLLDALHAGSSSDGGDTADTLIVLHVPAGGGRATAISIPRDSYVDVPGFGTHKINSAYSRAVAATTEALTTSESPGTSSSMFAPQALPAPSADDPAVRRAASAAGARTTVAAVEQLTGLPIDHYASINLAGFADVSTAVGGVPVCLRAPVDDPYSGLQLGAGPQLVSGANALAFVRQRHGLPGGDLDRIERQQAFLAGATEKLLSAGTLADPFALSRLAGVAARSITLDAGWNVLSFAQQLQGLRAGEVTFRTIPTGTPELETPYDGTAVEVDPAGVRTFVARSLAADAGVPLPAPAPAVPTAGASDAAAAAADTGSPTTTPTPAPITPTMTAATAGCVN